MKAKGSFEVKLEPLEGHHPGESGVSMGRMSIDKVFHGELSAVSIGEMLNVLTPVKGSAGYVALEQVTGELSGRKGSFVLQHYGTMDQGENQLILAIIPDSGTGELSGITGKMSIHIDGGQHFYEMEYELRTDSVV